MKTSESLVNIAVALKNFQAEVKNPANTANNPFFNSKYAPLADILNLIRPLLSKHGLSVIQMPGGDGESVSVTTLLLHESGEWIETDPLILRAEKVTAQGAGSAITYGRRYSLSAVLGISSEDDDDGNFATHGKPATKPKNKSTNEPTNNPKGYDLTKLWGSLRNLGCTDEEVHEFARQHFEKPDLTSLNEIEWDSKKVNNFVMYVVGARSKKKTG